MFTGQAHSTRRRRRRLQWNEECRPRVWNVYTKPKVYKQSLAVAHEALGTKNVTNRVGLMNGAAFFLLNASLAHAERCLNTVLNTRRSPRDTRFGPCLKQISLNVDFG